MERYPENERRPRDSEEQRAIDDVLADVLQDQVERERLREKAPVPRERGSGPLGWAMLFTLTFLSAYLWIAPPSFVQAPIPEPPRALVEAGVRMEVGLQALNVEDFLERAGRLPTSLEEAGDPFSLVSYDRVDAGSYQLSLDGPSGAVTYSSSDSLDEFMGNTMMVIQEGGVG